ncbi:MAG: hypothetical protein LBK60_10130 [Verrucomicrobiales bacterium]|jgi:hypothetical protein|nr:hypothetical protein [Verrucomicrobiales bacterium]
MKRRLKYLGIFWSVVTALMVTNIRAEEINADADQQEFHKLVGGLLLQLARNHGVSIRQGARPVLYVNAKLDLVPHAAGMAADMGKNYIWEMVPNDDGLVFRFNGFVADPRAIQAAAPAQGEFWLWHKISPVKLAMIVGKAGPNFSQQELAQVLKNPAAEDLEHPALRALVGRVALLLVEHREISMRNFAAIPTLYANVGLGVVAYHLSDSGGMSTRDKMNLMPGGAGLVIKFYGPYADDSPRPTLPSNREDSFAHGEVFEKNLRLQDGSLIIIRGRYGQSIPKQEVDKLLSIFESKADTSSK